MLCHQGPEEMLRYLLEAVVCCQVTLISVFPFSVIGGTDLNKACDLLGRQFVAPLGKQMVKCLKDFHRYFQSQVHSLTHEMSSPFLRSRLMIQS